MSNTTVSSVSRARRIALTVLGAATVAAGGLALAPHAGAAENPTKTPPAAVAPAQHDDNGDMNTTDMATKGFIVKNATGKNFHVVSWGGDRRIGVNPDGVFENTFKVGTTLAPGSEHRWEMLWSANFHNAWMTYAADDGSQATIKIHDDFFNVGWVESVTTPAGAKPVNYDIGYDYNTSGHLITLKN